MGALARWSRRLSLDGLEDRTVPAAVGYYDMGLGQGHPAQVAPITAAGHTAVELFDLTAADLAGIDVLFVQNANNAGYGDEYLARLADVQAAVAGGLTLVIHDRCVDSAELILPGGSGFTVVRSSADARDVNVLDDTTLATHGPGGVVSDASLDGGNDSDHGYALASSLPADAVGILTTGDPTHLVTFSYRYGFGNVVYSSIPLDYYLANRGANPTAMAAVYAPNVVAYAVDLCNVRPTAAPGSFSTAEDTAVTGRLGASDPDGDPLTFRIVIGPAHGTVTLTDPAAGTFVYTQRPDYSGPDSFTYEASDPRGGTAVGTVTITVEPVNDAPAAGPDAGASAGGAVALDVLANDADVEGDPLTVVSVTQGQNGSVAIDGGRVVYTPGTRFSGTDSFTYTVSDGNGGTATAAVTVTVTASNGAPAADAGPDVTAAEGDMVSFAAAASDPDGDPLVFVWDFGDGSTATGPAATHRYADDGVYRAVLTVADGRGGVTTAGRTVTVVNVAPAVSVSGPARAPAGQPAAFAAAPSDPGPADGLAVSWQVTDERGRVVAAGAGNAFTFTPDRPGSYRVACTVTDGDGGVGHAESRLTVTAPPAPPRPIAQLVTKVLGFLRDLLDRLPEPPRGKALNGGGCYRD